MDEPRLNRLWRPVAAALAALALLLSAFAWNPLSSAASGEARRVVASTVAVYATLRTLNVFLSAAQEVEVGGSLVVSGSVQPLKTLEPIDDTVEHVAGIVLTVSLVAGLLALGFAPLSVIGFALVLGGLVLWTVGPSLSRRMLTTGAVVAIAVPAVFVISGVIGDLMTRSVWEENRAILAEISIEVEASPVVSEAAPQTTSALRDAMGAISDFASAASVLVEKSDDLFRSYIAILAIYFLKIVFLPAVLLWIVWRVARA